VKFILKTALKILVLSIILVIPVGLLITSLSLNQRNIPILNLGIRNILQYAQNYSLLIFFISYLFASLLVTALIDKLKVKSIIALHLPAFIVGAVFAGGIYLTRHWHYPLSPGTKTVQLDHRTFIREGVFNEIPEKAIMLTRSSDNNLTLYLYDKTSDDLSITRNLKTGSSGKNTIFIDESKRVVTLRYRKNKGSDSLEIPFRVFAVENKLFDNPLINRYLLQIRNVSTSLRSYIGSLSQTEKYIFAGALFISVLMILIPLTYALNDRGWGFAGLVGIIIIIAITPFFYGAIINMFRKVSVNLSFLRQFSYLSIPLILCVIGIFLDILVKIIGRRKKQFAR
jgi:hypothetical protein